MANVRYTQTSDRKDGKGEKDKSRQTAVSTAKQATADARHGSGNASSKTTRARKRPDSKPPEGGPTNKKKKSTHDFAALPPNNSMITDEPIPPNRAKSKLLDDDNNVNDDEAFRSDNEHQPDHEDSARKRESDHGESDDDGALPCNNCVKKMKAMEIQDRNYMKLEEEKKALENRVALLQSQLSSFTSATSDSSVITKRWQIATSIDSKLVSFVTSELFKSKKFASDEVSKFLKHLRTPSSY